MDNEQPIINTEGENLKFKLRFRFREADGFVKQLDYVNQLLGNKIKLMENALVGFDVPQIAQIRHYNEENRNKIKALGQCMKKFKDQTNETGDYARDLELQICELEKVIDRKDSEISRLELDNAKLREELEKARQDDSRPNHLGASQAPFAAHENDIFNSNGCYDPIANHALFDSGMSSPDFASSEHVTKDPYEELSSNSIVAGVITSVLESESEPDIVEKEDESPEQLLEEDFDESFDSSTIAVHKDMAEQLKGQEVELIDFNPFFNSESFASTFPDFDEYFSIPDIDFKDVIDQEPKTDAAANVSVDSFQRSMLKGIISFDELHQAESSQQMNQKAVQLFPMSVASFLAIANHLSNSDKSTKEDENLHEHDELSSSSNPDNSSLFTNPTNDHVSPFLASPKIDSPSLEPQSRLIIEDEISKIEIHSIMSFYSSTLYVAPILAKAESSANFPAEIQAEPKPKKRSNFRKFFCCF